MKNCIYLFAITSLFFTACKKDEPPKDIMGYVPVYESDPGVLEIKKTNPQPIIIAGKIYIKDHLLYQVEVSKGIHVLDIQNPSKPSKVTFIQIPGAQELSIKGTLLYSNNFNDLVVIDIADINNVKLVNRVKSVFKIAGQELPPEKGYFECIDPDRGKIMGWEKKMLHEPQCRN